MAHDIIYSTFFTMELFNSILNKTYKNTSQENFNSKVIIYKGYFKELYIYIWYFSSVIFWSKVC